MFQQRKYVVDGSELCSGIRGFEKKIIKIIIKVYIYVLFRSHNITLATVGIEPTTF